MSELKGAQLADEPHIPERRATGLKAEKSGIEFTLTPGKVCVNPLIEIPDGSESPVEVRINGCQLTPADCAWMEIYCGKAKHSTNRGIYGLR
jgi:hypothetical protein